MHSLPGKFGELLIGRDGIPPTHISAVPDRDASSARGLLGDCLGNDQAMQVLRNAVDAESPGQGAPHLSDVDVIERAANLVAGGWLRLARPVPPPMNKGTPGKRPEEAARVISAPPPPSRAAVDSDEPFALHVDSAAMAATLLSASDDGAPFCEECARAARAA